MLVDKKSTNIKIVDFGLACKLKKTEEHFALCGSAEFVSPEVVNYTPVTSASDMWSIGVIT